MSGSRHEEAAARGARRRAQVRPAALVRLGSLLVLSACAASLPTPVRTGGRTDSYVAVTTPPPPLRPELVPPQPSDDAVWVDGEWTWDGSRYRWTSGAWVTPQSGAKLAPWALVRREDGQLFYSPSVWYDATGAVAPPPTPIVSAMTPRFSPGP